MIDSLRPLTDADLRSLALALRSGRLSSPFSATTLHRYCRPEDAQSLAVLFERLADEGMRPDHLALLLETAAGLRAEKAKTEEGVELVWTGPEMPGTAGRTRQIFGFEVLCNAPPA